MDVLGLQGLSIWVSIAAFLVAAAFVWGAGSRLSRYLDRISQKTNLGEGFVGLLLLGGITSLPEVATVSTASLAGNAPLAINNTLGSAAINVTLLAVADAFLGRRALTSVIGHPTPLLQGVLDIVLLTVVVVAILIGDVAILGVGAWSTALVLLFGFSLWLTSRYQHRRPWAADGEFEKRREENEQPDGGKGEEDRSDGSLGSYVAKTALVALVILVAGLVLAQSGDVIAQKTGIGASFVGLVLVGFATSLPEISSIYSAMKLERYGMVLGDIFGTNIFNIVLIFLADALYAGPPVLGQSGTFEAVATLLAILLTSIYLVGLLERRDRTVWRMGYPSLAVIVIYAGGVAALYALSSGGGGG